MGPVFDYRRRTAAKISLKVVSWATGHTLKSPKYQSDTAAAKRMRTLMTLLRSVARYIIYFIALLIVLSILGWASR